MDPLDCPRVRASISAATQAIAAAHRHRVNLRDASAAAAESLVRGARSVHRWEPQVEVDTCLSVFAMVDARRADTFSRSPLQVLAALDVCAGGDGLPVAHGEKEAERLQALAILVRAGGVAAGALLHGEIVGRRLFGSRSAVVGCAASRLHARAVGLDPKGLSVPEPHYARTVQRYWGRLDGYVNGDMEGFACAHFDAWARGGEEARRVADGIAGLDAAGGCG